MILYDARRCPYCARVRIVLAEKGLAHETVEIDLSDRPAWIYEKNPPHGRVPVLEEDGLVLPESAVLCEYLEELHPRPALLPSDPVERAAARLLVFRFDDLGDPYYALRRGEPRAAVDLGEALGGLDALLARSDWLTGAAFGLADVAYLPWILRAPVLLGVSFEPYPALRGWVERALERPAVAAEAEIVRALVPA